MKNSELPLYLKISPIYNKILQLAIAVIFIIVLLNMLIHSQNQQQQVITEHFSQLSKAQLQQAVSGLKVLLPQKNTQLINDYVNSLSESAIIYDIHYYDQTGLLLASSANAKNINSLYGIDELTEDESDTYVTFVEEVRNDELLGYLRFTINKKMVSKPLLNASFDVHEVMRLLVLFAVVIGFLLTRSFSRFSRQGFRVAK